MMSFRNVVPPVLRRCFKKTTLLPPREMQDEEAWLGSNAAATLNKHSSYAEISLFEGHFSKGKVAAIDKTAQILATWYITLATAPSRIIVV